MSLGPTPSDLIDFLSSSTWPNFNMERTQLTSVVANRILVVADLVKFDQILAGVNSAKFEQISVGIDSVEYAKISVKTD